MKKININYIFFGLFLITSAFSSLLNIFLLENSASPPTLFFVIYALGETLMEVILLILLAHLIHKFLFKQAFYMVIIFAFLLFISHIVDCFLLRIIDFSFWGALMMVINENPANLWEMIQVSGVSLPYWILLGLGLLSIPFIGIGLFKLTDKICQKKPLQTRANMLIMSILCLPAAILLWDISASPVIAPNLFTAAMPVLPLKTTLLNHEPKTIYTANFIKKPPCETKLKNLAQNIPLNPGHRPNIYIFVTESLREDFITAETAPALHQFKKDNIHFDLSLSNANFTPGSWFAIFHSFFPIYWTHLKDNSWKSGSLPLNVLKSAGYKIHVFSASGLNYYRMDEILFGANQHLLDTFALFPYYDSNKPDKSDHDAMAAMLAKQEPDGNVYIVFLESTHFNYSWPKEMQPKFTPFAPSGNLLLSLPSPQNLALLKNRYRNAIYYVDTLFQKFCFELKKKGLYDDAIIVFTGDHGEEFFEHGHMFHLSALNKQQTNVPLYYKFGQNTKKIKGNTSMTSHMDIFPSILHYIFDSRRFSHLMQGNSIFQKNPWPYTVTARFNGSSPPKDFCISTLREKLILRFKNSNILKAKKIKIMSYKDRDDQDLKLEEPELRPFQKAIDFLLKKSSN